MTPPSFAEVDDDDLPVIRFRVRRGSFAIARGLREHDPDRWALEYARGIEAAGPGAIVTQSRDGELDRFTWRVVTPYRCAY